MKKIDKIEMANGYVFMGDINLSISRDYFHLEDEGEKFDEMDRKKAKGKA